MITADLIVVGAGPGGYELAARRAAAGDSVIVVESNEPGGTCLNRGCIPTKCLCRSAEVLSTVRNAAEFGVDVSEIVPDYGRAVTRMRDVVAGLREGVEALLSRCTLVKGRASITPDGHVAVNGEVYSAPRVVIATGSKPSTLPVPGADLAVSSDDVLAMEVLPRSIVVIGGGVIGLEFASILNVFGVEVTVVEYCKEILPQFDREVAKRLRSMLSRRGVNFVVGSAVTAIVETSSGREVRYAGRKGEQSVSAEMVLMAVGRRPVVPEGLEAAGIELSPRGFIVTDADMQTTCKGIYAVGDCNGRLMLAHAASAQAERIYCADINLDVIPSAVFTMPEVAMVGKSAEQLDSEGVEYAVSKSLFSANGKARAMGEAEGLVKVLYDPATRHILGCHIIGPHAADLIQEAALAMSAVLTVDSVGYLTVHDHPTLGETLMSACRI